MKNIQNIKQNTVIAEEYSQHDDEQITHIFFW